MIADRRGHCLVGPIAVRGARAGQVLTVEFRSIRPDDWGFTVAGGRDNMLNRRLGIADPAPSWLLWQLDGATGVGVNDRGFRFAWLPSRRGGPAASGTGRTLHDPAPHPRRRKHRLPGAGGRVNALPADHRGRGASPRRRRPRRAGRRGGRRHSDRMRHDDRAGDRHRRGCAPRSIHAITPIGRITFGFSRRSERSYRRRARRDAALDAALFEVDRPTARRWRAQRWTCESLRWPTRRGVYTPSWATTRSSGGPRSERPAAAPPASAAMSSRVDRLRGRVAGQLGGVRVLVGVAVFKADETE